MSNMPIMGHLVMGYPSLEQSYQNARTYAKAGFEILELQIPFSHPTADGTVITQANRIATEENHVTIEDCFKLIKQLKDEFPQQEIVIMTYLNKVYHYGIDNFIEQSNQLGVKNLIIPDLPFDDVIAKKINASNKVKVIPVIAANIPNDRLEKAIDQDPDHFYIMSEFKITGQGFGLHENITSRIEFIKSKSKAKIGIGFGISTKEHVNTITSIADYAIIGSALINADNEGKLQEKVYSYI